MKKLFCDNWQFAKSTEETATELTYAPVDIPHDWLIYDTNNLYETSYGWYKKTLQIVDISKSYRLYFEGVYQDSTLFVNGKRAHDWKYGYTSFEADISAFLHVGDNEIVMLVRHEAPNSRWYSGAGIYRKVWLSVTEKTHLAADSTYFSCIQNSGKWHCTISAEICGTGYDKLTFTITDAESTPIHTGEAKEFTLTIPPEKVWDIANPYLFTLTASLHCDGEIIDSHACKIGFRSVEFSPNQGLLLNGNAVKLNGVCLHHDLGCLGAAINRDALLRQLLIMKEMGVTAIRTAHNPPAIELLEICDEIGLLVNNEFIDMWERPMTKYDYARFFVDWHERDVASWIRRDRNHPCVIMWSIGNEIYDTHASPRGLEVAKLLQQAVRKHDPHSNAFTTIGSNYMQWEGAQNCAEVVDLAGYNYGEHLYDEHHKKYPNWVIYGSENTAGFKSRGIYHFPLEREFLTQEDMQCSSLGNCKSGFDKLHAQDVLVASRDTGFCAGMFIWTGIDYIGEPTPYSTKNSYFGVVDTAGIKKDAFWLYKAAWTGAPVLHLLPHWDFNDGQEVDIIAITNLPEAELFINGRSLGKKTADMYKIAWKAPYEKGTICVVSIDENGERISAQRSSFGDSAAIVLTPDKTSIRANGEDLLTVEISTTDASGMPVENARDSVTITVCGARLLGFDNGDSSDYQQYKSATRKLFSGKAVAYIAAPTAAGEVFVKAASPGLPTAEMTLIATKCDVAEGISTGESIQPVAAPAIIPVRKIQLTRSNGKQISPDSGDITITAKILPENATFQALQWSVVTNSGIKTNNALLYVSGNTATLSTIGDGDFRVRCTSANDKPHADIISDFEFCATGFGTTTIDPYVHVPACLCANNSDFQEVRDGGLSIAGADKIVRFESVDFGKYGTDALEIPMIFWFSDAPVAFTLLVDGRPAGEFSHQANFVWNTYHTNCFALAETLTGVHDIAFKFPGELSNVNFGGFTFVQNAKAYRRIAAADYTTLHGDSYKQDAQRITEIGNNVFVEFHDMQFTSGASGITMRGRTRHENDSVHVHITPQNGDTIREIIEFPHSQDYSDVTMPLPNIHGAATISFNFLPGCDFDFDSFIVQPQG